MDLFAQYAAIFFNSHPHGLSPRPRGHTRTTHACHTVHVTAAPITHRGRCHTRVFGEFSEAAEEFARIPETAFGAPRSDSRGVGDVGRCHIHYAPTGAGRVFSCCGDCQTLDPSSVSNFGTLLEAHGEQAGGGAVAFARLLMPSVKMGLIDVFMDFAPRTCQRRGIGKVW